MLIVPNLPRCVCVLTFVGRRSVASMVTSLPESENENVWVWVKPVKVRVKVRERFAPELDFDTFIVSLYGFPETAVTGLVEMKYEVLAAA
jgi:hypothetical protein